MNNLASFDLTWDSSGRVVSTFHNLANLDYKAKSEIIAFSAPALLIQQLSAQIRYYGLQTIKGVNQALLCNFDVEPINESLVNARIELHSEGDAVFATFHPKMKLFSKFAEEGASKLIPNYIKGLLRDGSDQYTELTKVVLLYIISTYLEETMKPENYFQPVGDDKKLAAPVNTYCQQLRFHLYTIWRSEEINSISTEQYQELLKKYQGRLGQK